MKRIELQKFHKYIIAIILFKLIAMGLCSSGFQNELFMPFVNKYISCILSGHRINPYDYFYNIGRYDMFPYPPAMLAIESIGGVLSLLSGNNTIMQNILFKLPLLCFDILGLYYLVELFPEKRKYSAILYFSSPIIIYATYMHGQLDIIPTVLLLGSIYYLTKKRPQNYILSAVFLGIALATKLHILAAVPVIFIFIYKRDGIRRSIIHIVVSIGTLLLAMIPFWGEGLIHNVLFNQEQNALTTIYISVGPVAIYPLVLAVIIIYLKVFTIQNINKDLLYSLIGTLYTIFLSLVSPMPGWYVWVIPFLAIFFINVNLDKYKNAAIYTALNIAYIVYFIFLHKTKYVGLYYLNTDMSMLKIDNTLITNMMFTMLTGLLLYSAYMLYQLGVASNSYFKHRFPFTIGIAGDSGSGKSRFIKTLESTLGKGNLLFIEGDGDHKWERNDENWENFTHLNPKANYIYRQAQDLSNLHHGQHIKRVDYNHRTGMFTKAITIRPKPYTILCGLHALYLPQTRENLDLKIYMDIDETLRRYWKIQRDTTKRGHSVEEIIKSIDDRTYDAEKYIYPQKQYADLIIRLYDPSLISCMEKNHKLMLNLKLTMSSSIDMEELIDVLGHYDIQAKYDYSSDLKKQTIIFSGNRLMDCDIPFDSIASQLVPRLEEITRQTVEDEDNIHGIIQIVLILIISEIMQRGSI